jgi:transcriptional regulator with GAF, ATPase, and Fis domain
VSSPDSEELRGRLRELLAEAKSAGLLGDLRTVWENANAVTARVETVSEKAFPGRFGMIGESPEMLALFDLINRVARSNVSVLIHGETGTGKELVARALHEQSDRAGGPFVAENCAAVPPNLLESELFGHKRGSFTGAIADRDGRFVSANGGTLFLDEIGDMPLEMQSKLLRVLEAREVRPVGSEKVQKVDVRVVAASHRDLELMIEERSFRQDLFYRLNVVRLDLPPLRERGGDVEILARFFIRQMTRQMGLEAGEIDAQALAALAAAPWPGNVRQLENEIQRTLALSGGSIGLQDLSKGLSPESLP